jgi:hypothetical protein
LEGIEFRSADPHPDPEIFRQEYLRQRIPIRDGDIFSRRKMQVGLDALRRFYGTRGYLDFTCLTDTKIDRESETITVALTDITQGPQYRLGSVQILGLDPATESHLISKLKVGEVLDYNFVDDFYHDNKGVLPVGAAIDDSPRIELDRQRALAYLTFDFRVQSLPQADRWNTDVVGPLSGETAIPDLNH